jgi:DNA integrity scanning protein DisA with diadenylate cyclase activity
MWKLAVVGATTIFVTASPLAHAQTTAAQTPQPLSATDSSTLTDARVNIIKAALQLSPDQEKYWPAVEQAIRQRAAHRQARMASVANRIDQLRNGGVADAVVNRNPIEFLHRRADALSQRAQDLQDLANAWQPLYQTLNPDQKRRMALLAVFVLRDVGHAVQQRVSAADAEAQD